MRARRPSLPNRVAVLLGIAAELVIGSAGATILPIRSDPPVATVEVPASWNPMIVTGGVEGFALEGAVHLAVEFISASDPDSAAAAATQRLAERKVIAAPATKRVGARRFNSFDAFKIDFDGVDANGDCNITLILIAMPGKSGFVNIAYWATTRRRNPSPTISNR